MQDLIKRYFWVLGALVVMTCAVFAAKATGHVLEATFLGDPKTGPKAAAVAPAPTPIGTHTAWGSRSSRSRPAP